MKRKLPVTQSWLLMARTKMLRHDLLLAALVACLVIAGGSFLGWENNKVVPANPDPAAHYLQEEHAALHFLSNWDGPDYLAIAQHGYKTPSQTNLFPLYPLTIHIVNKIVHSTLYSALLISWFSLLGAIYFYLRIIKRLWPVDSNSEALRGVLLFVFFPTGVFLIATYTESLFALFALGSVYYALQKKYLQAAFLTMLATATHVNGLFVLVLILMILWEQQEKLTRILLTLAIGSLGIVSYAVYLLSHFERPLDFITVQRELGWVQRQGYLDRLLMSIDPFSAMMVLLLIAAIVYWWKRRKSFSIYCCLYLCIPLLGGQFGGFNRYVLMASPIQFMFYDRFRNSSSAYPVTIVLSAIFWAYFTLQYAGGYVGG